MSHEDIMAVFKMNSHIIFQLLEIIHSLVIIIVDIPWYRILQSNLKINIQKQWLQEDIFSVASCSCAFLVMIFLVARSD